LEDHLVDQGVGGKMGSEWILGRLVWGCELDSTGSGQGPSELVRKLKKQEIEPAPVV
jgi:hypothetical protein